MRILAELRKIASHAARTAASGLIDAAVTSGSTLVVGGRLPDGIDAGDLRSLATDLRGKVADKPAVVVLFSATGTKVPFVVATTDSAREAGIKAGDLVKQIAPLVGGRGGGKPDLAQGSGTDVGGADAAMARIRELVLR